MTVRPAQSMPSQGGPGRLVVIDGPQGGLGRWEAVVSALAGVLDLEPAVEPAPGVEGGDPIDAVLERAAAVAGPVLVLPGSAPAEVPPPPAPALTRALAPFDASDEEAAATRPLLARLQDSGMDVAQLHVVTAETMPAMWEGAGHHARAWHAELRRRHRVAEAAVEVVAGASPAAAVLARSVEVQLVVLGWKRRAQRGRAKVVRNVLATVDVPVLLLPLG